MTTRQFFKADWQTSQAKEIELIEVGEHGVIWELRDANGELAGWYGRNFGEGERRTKKWKKQKLLKN